MKIGVLGAGSWGTALTVLLNENGHDVTVWSIDKEEIAMLKEYREHKTKLPEVKISENVVFTTEIEEAIDGAKMIVMVVPSPFIRSTAKMAAPYVKEGQIIVNVSKGIEESSLKLLDEIIKEEIPCANVAVLSGPSHAEEVGKGMPTTVVAGAYDKETAMLIQDVFMSDYFRVYTSPDVVGIELGGALKNVIALAAGVSDGLGCGDNAKAALITRGIVEITKLGVAMGGQVSTFAGLSGIGDLIVTCTSLHSRNRRAGVLIGKGVSPKDAIEQVKMVVEGVKATPCAYALSQKYNVDMPIVTEAYRILFENKSPEEAVYDLMCRKEKREDDYYMTEKQV